MIPLCDLLAATGGQLYGAPGATTFGDLAYDSRLVQAGQLFLAVVTETGDGHDYIAAAVRAGATGVLCQRPPAQALEGITCVVVENTQAALLDYARYILAARQVEVVGITGSVGKTSAKEAIAAVLGTREHVFRNYGNYNGRYGLPIALGKLEEGQRRAVLEMGADTVDEIRTLAEVTRPRVGVVTQVSHSHLHFFGSLEAIAREKGALVEALPAEGLAVLNRDDARVWAMRARTRARVCGVGLTPEADYWAEAIQVTPTGTTLLAHGEGVSVPLRLPLLGAHHALTALIATAVGRYYGLTWEEIAVGLAQMLPIPGRTQLLEGMQGSLLLDDSYNASPSSTLAALETLYALPATRRLVLLGDMTQLGDYAAEAHRQVGRQVAQVAEVLVTKGELAQLAAEEALRAGMPAVNVHVTSATADAVQVLRELLRPGDLLLLKGSAEARLELVARELLREPERAPQLLARQDAGWAQVRLERPGRPTWLELDLRAIAHNVRRVAEIVGPQVAVMAVLKADGYGHGAITVARTALLNGATWLGVACLGEALALRHAGLSAPILVLGYTPPWQAREAILNDVTVTLFAPELATALSRAALDLGRVARAHLKVDTGMGRLGLLPEEVLPFWRTVRALPGLELEGLFTHMANADAEDLSYTHEQLARFEGVLAALRDAGWSPRLVHAANSAALLRLPQSRYGMVRLGLAMYGLNPSPSAPCPADFQPALSLKSQLAQVKELPTGSAISYGCTYRTARPSRIAVIPIGYADGFRRAPQHWGVVLVRGQRAPIVGRVCMDQTMIDVTDIPGARAGDEVVLIGRQGAETLTVDEVAARLGTINYEVVSEILARVPRMV